MNHTILGNMAKKEESATWQAALDKANEELKHLSVFGDKLASATARLARVTALMGLEQKDTVWDEARPILDIFVENDDWERAAETCEILYRTEHTDALAALIQGVWLAVSFPIDPELTVLLLDHLTEAMPPKTEGPGLAAATAHYIVSIRASDEAFENLNFLTTNLLAQAAKNYGEIDSQEMLDFWISSHELDKPELFLPRLGKLLTAVLKENAWWISRDAIRAKFPQ